MSSPDLEARALALACRLGLLRAPLGDGTRLESLVAQGILDEGNRDRLLWEAMQEENPGGGASYPASWTMGGWGEAAPDPEAISRFGPYESLELIGVGGQGRVYRAFDPRLQRHVALKLLNGGKPQAHLSEARAQAQVEHRNVCRVYEVGEVECQPYIALQLIRGSALGSEMAAPKEVVRWIRDAAEGIHAAHRQGLLHLDLKPSNLMVSGEGGSPLVYVTDFGLASEAHGNSGRPLGSPPYCAPEQINRTLGSLDQRTDVYGLGATLYVALTGQLPFRATSITDLLQQIQTQEPLAPGSHGPSVPPDLAAILLKAMAKAPADRYATALAFADDLERWLTGMPILARPSSLAGRIFKGARRNPLAGASLALLGLLLFGIGAWALRTASQRRHMRALLQTFSEDMRTLELRLYAMRMLPPEDHRIIEADLRHRLKGIEASLEDMGDLAPAGHYALGLGYRSLREWEPAARHLRSAWEAGFRSPESAEATGITYGILTTVLTQKAQALPEAERAKVEAEIQREWGGPGRVALATFAGTPFESPYSKAMEAYHHKDFDAVFTHCSESARRQPWQVGTWRFMLTCALEDPAAAARHGLAPDAEGQSPLVRRIAATAPGDAVSQDLLGEHWTRQAALPGLRAEARHGHYQRAFEAFQIARTILPDQHYPFHRAIELCEMAVKADSPHAARWRNRLRRILETASKEPALAQEARERGASG